MCYQINHWLLTAGILFALGCAHPGPEKPDDHFETTVATDGSKRFIYTLDYKDLPAYQPQTLDSGNNQKRHFDNLQDEKRDEAIGEILRRGLDQTIRKTKFCLTGYFVIEQRIKWKNAYIRGECREAEQENNKPK